MYYLAESFPHLLCVTRKTKIFSAYAPVICPGGQCLLNISSLLNLEHLGKAVQLGGGGEVVVESVEKSVLAGSVGVGGAK